MKKSLLLIFLLGTFSIAYCQFSWNYLPNTFPWPQTGPASVGTSYPTTTSQFEVTSDITRVESGGLGTTPLTVIGYSSQETLSTSAAPIFDVKYRPFINSPGINIFSVTDISVDVAVTTNLSTTFLNDKTLFLRSDYNHYLGFSNSFAGHSLDGPVLAGYTSGILGTTQNGNKMALYWNKDGKVGIGTSNLVGSHKLYVGGSILAEELLVKLQGNWPDYVFDSNYKLTSLNDIEKYIKKEGHLPNVPTAEMINKNGVKVGEMNAILLQKIEELTLHLIELNKEIEVLKKK